MSNAGSHSAGKLLPVTCQLRVSGAVVRLVILLKKRPLPGQVFVSPNKVSLAVVKDCAPACCKQVQNTQMMRVYILDIQVGFL